MQNKKERKCCCSAEFGVQSNGKQRDYSRHPGDEEGIERIKLQLERKQILSGFPIMPLCGVPLFKFSTGHCTPVCLCEGVRTYFVCQGACRTNFGVCLRKVSNVSKDVKKFQSHSSRRWRILTLAHSIRSRDECWGSGARMNNNIKADMRGERAMKIKP